MKVAGLQMDLAWEDPAENFRRARGMARAAMETRASESIDGALEGPPELLVLPEMFATGFSMEAMKVAAVAEEARAFLQDLAVEMQVHVLAGYAEPGDPRPANACSIFDPRGQEILHFQKLHPFSLAREDEHYQPGESLSTVVVGGAAVTPLICYDLRFPEPFRAAAQDTDLYCVLANWPSRRSHAWSTLLKARAMENQAFVLGVNRVGMGGGELHTGDSALLDPLGMEVQTRFDHASGPDTSPLEAILMGDADPSEVRAVRRRFGFLADARPSLYRKLEADRREGL